VLTVSSEIDQEVWISAHTVTRDFYPRHYHKVRRNKIRINNGKPKLFDEVYSAYKPYELFPEEPITVDLEFDFTDEKLPSDWSLVVWGSKGKVEVRHS